MQAVPYLNFDGNCAEAFRYYERLLGGKIEGMMTFGESPAAAEYPAMRDRILHVRLAAGDIVLFGSDCPPGTYAKPQGIYVALNLSDRERAQQIFDALADGGTVTMPFEQTFWAERFGMLVDRFGIPWMVNCAPSPAAATQGA